SPLMTSLGDAFKLISVEVNLSNNKIIIQDCIVEVNIVIESCFPKEIVCTQATISVEEIKDGKRQSDGQRVASGDTQHNSKSSNEEQKPTNPALVRLHMMEHLDYKQDKSLGSASIISKNPKQFLRRTDSHGKYRKISNLPKGDFSSVLSIENIKLQPGRNEFTLKAKAQDKGLYRLGQLSLLLEGNLEFLSSTISPRVSYEVMREPSTVTLNKGEKDLLAGLEQEMVLTVSAGSYTIAQNTCLKLRTSRGLQMQVKTSEEPLVRELEVPLPQSEPFQTLSILLRVLAELPPQKDSSTIEHKVTLQCPWTTEEKTITLHFQPPLMSSFRLHTAHTRKFVQIVIVGLNVQMLELREPSLVLTTNQDVKLASLSPTKGQKITTYREKHEIYDLEVGCVEDLSSIKTEFTVHYSPVVNLSNNISDKHIQIYRCNFDITDYKTLFVVKSRVEPMKGSEFCRAGTMCHLQLHVQRVNASSHNSLMYEVLADQTMWAVCGRTAGVISLESVDKQNVTLDVMPLIGGFLPLPLVRLSKYIPADQKASRDTNRKPELSSHASSHPRLEPFSPGQVYNSSKAQQVHVLPSSSASD
ncbi:hypothetical protein L9F63_013449, partial [Diploptera punctata]